MYGDFLAMYLTIVDIPIIASLVMLVKEAYLPVSRSAGILVIALAMNCPWAST